MQRLPDDADLPPDGPRIVFQPLGLADLYARFFSDPRALKLLSQRLGALGMKQSIALEVAWDEARKVGTITLFVPEEERRPEALLPALNSGGPVPAQELGILMQPLGRYRAGLAERFDLRILSFHIKLGFMDPATGAYCTIAGDRNDPEGGRVGPCFRCLVPRLGAQELCRQGDRWPAPIQGEGRALSMLRSALRSQP